MLGSVTIKKKCEKIITTTTTIANFLILAVVVGINRGSNHDDNKKSIYCSMHTHTHTLRKREII